MDIIRLSLAQENFTNTTCLDTEREALLSFKQGLQDPLGRLSSWTGVDCCQWSGIRCSISGNVIKLDLSNPFTYTNSRKSCFGGELNSSLLQLKNLEYLDLSSNCFEGLQIPEFFGMLKNLRYLNLSFSSFGGEIPPHIGNLSSLNHLDLNTIDFVTPISYSLSSGNLQWLSGLISIKHLNMGNVNLLGQGSEFLKAVNMLPFLEELHLHSCALDNLPLSLSYVNLTLLSVLDLSDNEIQSSIPNWISNLTSLTKLDLSNDYYNLNGNIPRECGDKDSKENLDPQLYYGIEGQIPGSLGILCGLKVLNLSGNLLTGKVDEFLDSFTTVCPDNSLVSLSLSGNQLTGALPSSLGKLKYLKQLHISHNCFSGSVPESIGNLLFLQELDISLNEMNGTIPRSLGQLSKITVLNFEDNHWQGVITEDHIMNLTRLQYLYVSTDRDRPLVFNVTTEWNPPFRLLSLELYNCIVGPTFPAWIRVQSKLNYVILHNAGIEDTIPDEWFFNISSQVIRLELSDNKIKGKLPQKLKFPELQAINLRKNRIEGSLPLWLTNATEIYLQQNLFSGPIPDVISELTQLRILDVSKNRLTGRIPSSICTMTVLEILSLRENQLSGQLPKCWNDYQQIYVLDTASNNLSGEIPSSMGLLRYIFILSLSNNSLSGEIPLPLQNCTTLQILDLGDNSLSGNLPLWIGNDFTQLWILRLRSNKLSGIIPEQWCNLSILHILDLSENSLSGVIPRCMGYLSSLMYTKTDSTIGYIDLVTYNFEEQIFTVTKGREMEYSSTLAMVNIINLSSNNLTGNPLLCGKPLLSKCPGSDEGSNVPISQSPDNDSESELQNLWFYCLGYVFGICGVWCTLWKIDTWREAYFRFLKLA
ncbi:Leucine-rich repeat receptor protein kinase EXS-like [Heracleum sosnowskyi]|uniref:Leucine-rich repeat receptor protein kinase EXS-like n=1 Tax=Heracleum sosnowskyi TaxID=360622 RepID=A0AAD8MD94_9APIA|nr:Leucine-rich repeat receptor protein kinase EXS-like [Heracleum sosnowskyi]